MSIECVCGGNVGNLGSPICPPKLGKILRANFVSQYKSDGTENYIDTTGTLNKAFWDALQYHADTAQRIYPLPENMEDVESAREESVFKVYGSGRRVKIRQGFRNITGQLPEVAAALVGKINARGCSKQGAYFHTTVGMMGVRKEAGKVHPILLSQDSIDAILALQNETDPQMITIMMQWALSVLDQELVVIPYSAITGIDMMTQFNGKLDTNIEQVGTGTATQFVVKITTDYGDGVNMQPVPGLVLADFVVYNVTDSAGVTPSAVVESPAGTYTFTVPSQTVTDIERLSLATTDAAKPFDDATWADVQITHQ